MKKLFMITGIILMLVGSCREVQTDDGFFGQIQSEYREVLPTNATNIQNLGNGWIKFDLEIQSEKRTFMFFRGRQGYKGYSAITEISK